MPARAHPEAALQRQVAAWLRFASHGQPWTWTASNPNPVKGMIAGKIAKGMGLRAGWPDFVLVHQGRAIFIELKAPKGRLSPEQVACHAELTRAGAVVAVCRSLGEVEQVLHDAGVPLAVRF